MAYNLKFVSNNVNGLRSSKNCIKIFEYLKNKIHNNSIILQETHSSENSNNGIMYSMESYTFL